MEIKKRKEWEKRSKQNRLIDIAEELFFENGYETTTLDHIAKAAGYSKRNLYQYFSDKDDLFYAVILKSLKKLNSKLDSICSKHISGIDMLAGICNAVFDYFLNHRRSFEYIIFFDIKYFYDKQKNMEFPENSFGVAAENIHNKNMELIVKSIIHGINDGTISTRFSARQLQLVVYGQLLGIIHAISVDFDTLEKNYGLTPEKFFADYIYMLRNCFNK